MADGLVWTLTRSEQKCAVQGSNYSVRGSSWGGLPRGVRAVGRNYDGPDRCGDLIGFRLAYDGPDRCGDLIGFHLARD